MRRGKSRYVGDHRTENFDSLVRLVHLTQQTGLARRCHRMFRHQFDCPVESSQRIFMPPEILIHPAKICQSRTISRVGIRSFLEPLRRLLTMPLQM